MLIVSKVTEDGKTYGPLSFIMLTVPDMDTIKRIMTERYGEGCLKIHGDGRTGHRGDTGYDYTTEDQAYFVIATP